MPELRKPKAQQIAEAKDFARRIMPMPMKTGLPAPADQGKAALIEALKSLLNPQMPTGQEILQAPFKAAKATHDWMKERGY